MNTTVDIRALEKKEMSWEAEFNKNEACEEGGS